MHRQRAYRRALSRRFPTTITVFSTWRSIGHREVIERLDAVVARGARIMANRAAKILRQMFKYGIHRAIVEQSPVNLLFNPGGARKNLVIAP